MRLDDLNADAFNRSSEFQLIVLWYSIRRHTRSIIIIVLLFVALAGIRSYMKPDLYRASVQVLVEKQSQIIGGSVNYFRLTQPIDTDILKRWILSSSVMEKLKKILGPEVPVGPGNFRINLLTPSDRVRNMCLLDISATSRNPEHSYRMVQSIVKAFRAQLMDNQLQQSREALSWMTERLADQKRKMEEAEARFQEYKEKIKVLSFDAQKVEESKRILDASSELNRLETERLQLEVELKKLKESRAKGVEYSDLVFKSMKFEDITKWLNELNGYQAELKEKSKIFKSKHPKIVELNEKIGNLRQRIENKKKNAITTLEIQIRTIKEHENILKQSIEANKEKAHEIAQNELQYRILEREVQTNTELYNSLLSELERTDLRGKFETMSVTVIEPPRVPSFPIPKQIPKNLFMAAIAGLIIGCGLAILRDYFEPTFRTPEDVERVLQIPVVGMIPERE